VRAALAGLVLALTFARTARAEDWVYEGDDVESRAAALIRFSSRFDVWVATFDRPPRACETDEPPIRPPFRGLRAAQFFPPDEDPFCPSSSSDEIAIGTGIEIAFRVLEVIYLTAGIDLLYTEPDSSRLKNQIIIPVPFGVLLTFYEWSVRPIVHARITPVLYLTDDARDYTLGGELGAAFRVMDFGDLSLTLGYETAETMNGVQIAIALHPLP
jgi:hypothetical protein